jgi:hypothetical protein
LNYIVLLTLVLILNIVNKLLNEKHIEVNKDPHQGTGDDDPEPMVCPPAPRLGPIKYTPTRKFPEESSQNFQRFLRQLSG